MGENIRVLRVQANGATGEMTVIVVPEGQAGAVVVPVPEPRHDWPLSALPVAGMLFRAFSGSAALELMHLAQRIRWAEALHWWMS